MVPESGFLPSESQHFLKDSGRKWEKVYVCEREGGGWGEREKERASKKREKRKKKRRREKEEERRVEREREGSIYKGNMLFFQRKSQCQMGHQEDFVSK